MTVTWGRDLERWGFAIVDRLLDAGALDRWQSALEPLDRGRSSAYVVRHLFHAAPEIRALAVGEPLRSMATSVLGRDPRPVRALLFDKRPSANWSVPWHQDATIAVTARRDTPGFGPWSVKDGVHHVRPPASVLYAMVTFRLHLDPCGAADGPVEVIPGSHRGGVFNDETIGRRVATAKTVTCVIPAGGGLIMRPLLLHRSGRARRPMKRRVVHLEFSAASLPGGLQWHEA